MAEPPDVDLFTVETDRATVHWQEARDAPSPVAVPGTRSTGVLAVIPQRGQPVAIRIAGQLAASGAPFYLFEQHGYVLSAWTDPSRTIRITHRDPNLAAVARGPAFARTYQINFGGQIGRSVFTVLVDGEPELDIAVEVVPTKLDYASDYLHLVADVQGVLTGLALDYLRATYQLGRAVAAPRPTELEWLVLLDHVIGTLEHALGAINARPVRSLGRELRERSVMEVRAPDDALRGALRHGRGAHVELEPGLVVPELVEYHLPQATLDTPEHRWLAEQVREAQHRLAELQRDTRARPANRRRAQILDELGQLQHRLAALGELEVLRAANGLPPPGFESRQLTSAPGYGEAYGGFETLRLGLHIRGSLLQLTFKDIGELYEYWCYLTVLRVVGDELGAPLDPGELMKVDARGLEVELVRGRTTRAQFRQPDGDREIVVTFNPRFSGQDMLIAQRPDILITLRERGWPAMHLVIDAKYRVDASPAYLEANEVPGPPQDAINVLHRYRDAIVEQASPDDPRDPRDPRDRNDRPRRSVIQAIALFPGTTEPAAFRQTRFWRTIDRIGIGVIPLVPERDALLREWLRGALLRGGWALADRAPRYAAIERARDWQEDASRPLLIGVLRGADPAGQLAWITRTRRYYMRKLADQPRQLRVARLALYSPAELTGGAGAVEWVADVTRCDVVARREIATPWAPRDPDEPQVMYWLGPLERRELPIVNRHGERLSSHRWSSVLALGRARELRELLLETEPEWRLYETLRGHRAHVELEPGPARLVDSEDPAGRTWLVVDGRRARHDGGARFVLDGADRPPGTTHDLAAACGYLLGPDLRP